ncbi:MAG: hypothetical protein ACREOI_33440 [bacterium]
MTKSKKLDKRSLKSIVGEKTYSVWVEMLKQLLPNGRTHRLSVVVASMLQYASQIADEKFGHNHPEGSAASSLIFSSEGDSDEIASDLSDIVEQLFNDAKVRYTRTSSRGEEYSIVEASIMEYLHWHDMPWE